MQYLLHSLSSPFPAVHCFVTNHRHCIHKFMWKLSYLSHNIITRIHFDFHFKLPNTTKSSFRFTHSGLTSANISTIPVCPVCVLGKRRKFCYGAMLAAGRRANWPAVHTHITEPINSVTGTRGLNTIPLNSLLCNTKSDL